MTSNNLVLVTGATGFIAGHVIKTLFENGYRVRGTVRKLEDPKTETLKKMFDNGKDELQLVEADLMVDASWKDAMKDVDYVLHVASPFPFESPSDPDVLIKPAVDGTLSVLRAASESGTVKRVVLTSSVASVYDPSLPIPKEAEETKVLNEEFWTDGENPQLDYYAKSKLLAEKAAWNYVKELPDDKKIELVVINPGLVLGPLLAKQQSTSLELIKRLLERSTPAVAKMLLVVTDVRDVALAHVKALTNNDAVGHRHLIFTKHMWMRDIALILKKEFGSLGYHVPTLTAPNWIVYLNSYIDRALRVIYSRLGRDYKFENKRMTEVLGITPTDETKTIIDSANSLIELGVVKPPKKSKKAQAQNDSPAENKQDDAKNATDADNKVVEVEAN